MSDHLPECYKTLGVDNWPCICTPLQLAEKRIMNGWPVGDSASIGAAVRGLRKRKGLSQTELAHRIGVSLSTIQSLEKWTGEDMSRGFNAKTIRGIRQALGIRIEYRWVFDDD